jgi:3-phenylpropionate/trans-cinnamate dioxygenase ferredoxin subunit
MGRFIKIAEHGDVQPGKVKGVRGADRKVALFNENGVILAYEDYCTHTGGPLTQGSCEHGVVTCLGHGAQFRIADGAPLTPPAGGPLPAYTVRVSEGAIEIEMDD